MMVAALNAESDDEEEEQGVGGDEPKKTHPKKIKRMLELLCNEAGFLVHNRKIDEINLFLLKGRREVAKTISNVTKRRAIINET